ncbi:hypothetical protein OAI07_01155 [Akkermansiaceae bacterium]|nr:hypothetical protein [Akkermansiaceae bacterium]
MEPNQQFETIEELLPSFIDFLKTMPCLYNSDADNAWENWIELPEMHCEDGPCDVHSVLDEWASLHIKKHLKVEELRENWLHRTSEGGEALEEHRDFIEKGEEFPESIYPSLEEMADLFTNKLIDDAHSKAYYINLYNEEEIEEEDDLDGDEEIEIIAKLDQTELDFR